MNSATRTSGSQNVKECYRGEHSFSWSRSGHEKKEINEEKQKKSDAVQHSKSFVFLTW